MLDQYIETLHLFQTILCVRSFEEDASATLEERREVALVHLREIRAIAPELNDQQFEGLLVEAAEFSARWDRFLSDVPD